MEYLGEYKQRLVDSFNDFIYNKFLCDKSGSFVFINIDDEIIREFEKQEGENSFSFILDFFKESYEGYIEKSIRDSKRSDFPKYLWIIAILVYVAYCTDIDKFKSKKGTKKSKKSYIDNFNYIFSDNVGNIYSCIEKNTKKLWVENYKVYLENNRYYHNLPTKMKNPYYSTNFPKSQIYFKENEIRELENIVRNNLETIENIIDDKEEFINYIITKIPDRFDRMVNNLKKSRNNKSDYEEFINSQDSEDSNNYLIIFYSVFSKIYSEFLNEFESIFRRRISGYNKTINNHIRKESMNRTNMKKYKIEISISQSENSINFFCNNCHDNRDIDIYKGINSYLKSNKYLICKRDSKLNTFENFYLIKNKVINLNEYNIDSIEDFESQEDYAILYRNTDNDTFKNMFTYNDEEFDRILKDRLLFENDDLKLVRIELTDYIFIKDEYSYFFNIKSFAIIGGIRLREDNYNKTNVWLKNAGPSLIFSQELKRNKYLKVNNVNTPVNESYFRNIEAKVYSISYDDKEQEKEVIIIDVHNSKLERLKNIKLNWGWKLSKNNFPKNSNEFNMIGLNIDNIDKIIENIIENINDKPDSIINNKVNKVHKAIYNSFGYQSDLSKKLLGINK